MDSTEIEALVQAIRRTLILSYGSTEAVPVNPFYLPSTAVTLPTNSYDSTSTGSPPRPFDFGSTPFESSETSASSHLYSFPDPKHETNVLRRLPTQNGHATSRSSATSTFPATFANRPIDRNSLLQQPSSVSFNQSYNGRQSTPFWPSSLTALSNTMTNGNGPFDPTCSMAPNLNRTCPARPSRYRRRAPSCVECVFCKNNGEEPDTYRTHILKDPDGKIICPKLRKYNCPICNNNGGDFAHTIRYCPFNRPQHWRRNRLQQLITLASSGQNHD